jgi:hypothetical protein
MTTFDRDVGVVHLYIRGCAMFCIVLRVNTARKRDPYFTAIAFVAIQSHHLLIVVLVLLILDRLGYSCRFSATFGMWPSTYTVDLKNKRSDGNATSDTKSTLLKDTRLMPTAAAPVEPSDERATTQLPSVATATAAIAKSLSIPATQIKQRYNRRRKKDAKVPGGGEAKEGTRHSEVSEPLPFILHAAPPMDDDDDDECENEDNFGIREEENRGKHDNGIINVDDVRPGAVKVRGINPREVSQQSFIYSDHQGATQEEAKEDVDDNTSLVPSSVVAEAVDDDQLFHETLARLKLEMVEADNVVMVEGDSEGKKQRRANIKKRTIGAGALILAVVIIAAVLIAVFASRSSNNKQPRQQTPTTAPSQQPTAAPITLLEVFRSVLLDHNVSTIQDLDHYNSPQSHALNWLANDDKFLNASSSVESVIDRYVLAVVYYADGGTHWNHPSIFLTNESICTWHNFVANGTGAFCTTSKNVSLGKCDLRALLVSFTATVIDIDNSLLVLSYGLAGSIPTKIVLDNNSLVGPIPSELGQLTGLTYLNLGYGLNNAAALSQITPDVNQLNGMIPSELGQLTSLTYLDLGEIPNVLVIVALVLLLEIGVLMRLSVLPPTPCCAASQITEYNRLTGTMPTELGRLSNLTDLKLCKID